MGKGRRSSERPLQKVLGKGANVNEDNPLEVHDPKVGSLISYEGVTTADGAGAGTTLIDTVLTTKPDYNGNLVIITSGAYAGQARDINGATTGGTVSPHLAFGGQILSGTTFAIAAIRLTPAEVAALTALVTALMADVGDASTATLGSILGILGDPATAISSLIATVDTVVDAVKVSTDKLAGATPVSSSTTANWNTGTGTSTEAGGDVVTIGANDTKYKLHSLVLDVSALTDGASIRVKLFMQVNGVEKKVYDQAFTVPTGTTPPDTDGLWIVNGSVGIHEALRVEVYSDTDESKAIAYDYMLEVM